ncbi:hypothetical protein OSB04_025459 [Centaurea solstitialis]|uniref:Uncharacterized protein n=1 Tax=Centaurea solstitialis TaxID=347529 RepID=A0AA38W1R1_9ASTR|nr:hypothetical protein OSB04_025459 [Centaurea solstitialis]
MLRRCVTSTRVKANGSTVQKNKGGLRARKALNDISNSKNVIPIGEDLGVPKKAQIGGKPQISGKKPQVSGRKALGDLTNSVKPFGQQQGLKRRVEKKSITVAEDEDENFPNSIAQEGFLHNHDECIKSHKSTMDLHHFLKTIGLDEDVSCPSVSARNTLPVSLLDDDPIMAFGIEEIPLPTIEERPHQFGGQSSPICGSPNSPRMSYMNDWDDFPSFILAESPRRLTALTQPYQWRLYLLRKLKSYS